MFSIRLERMGGRPGGADWGEQKSTHIVRKGKLFQRGGMGESSNELKRGKKRQTISFQIAASADTVLQKTA